MTSLLILNFIVAFITIWYNIYTSKYIENKLFLEKLVDNEISKVERQINRCKDENYYLQLRLIEQTLLWCKYPHIYDSPTTKIGD